MKVLLINQSFYPDLAASGQYLTDLARALTDEGAEVSVLSARRAYLNHHQLFRKREDFKGITVHRVWSVKFPRVSPLFRVLDALLLNLTFAIKYLLLPRTDRVVVLTSPPLLVWFIVIANSLKRAPLVHWGMDINPAQAIKTGWLAEGGLPARLLNLFNRFILSRIDQVITLDSAMKDTLLQIGVSPEKISVQPLWSDSTLVSPLSKDHNPFVKHWNLQDRFVVMYSGNHSICHPLNTLLEAAKKLREKPITFLFVGGGPRFSEISRFREQHQLSNIIQQPYQSREQLRESLNVADLQVVSMGEPYVGLVHPSKVYGILAAGIPILYLGPQESPIAKLIDYRNLGRLVKHGEVEGMVQVISELFLLTREKRDQWSMEILKVAKEFDRAKLALILVREILR